MVGSPPPGILTASGFLYPFRGFRFLVRHPRLLGHIAIPIAINAAVYGAFAWFVGTNLGGWLEGLVPRGEAWFWAVLFYALATVAVGALLMLSIYTFTVVGNLILSPFNGFLSEAVERTYAGHALDAPFSLPAVAQDAARSVRAEVGRLGLYVSGFLLLLTLYLVPPPLGPAAHGVGLTAFTLFFLGWEYLDYSMERAQFTFSQKRRAALRNAGSFLGFGAGAALMLLIPLMQLVAIPVCVAGATLLFVDLRQAGRLPGGPQAPG